LVKQVGKCPSDNVVMVARLSSEVVARGEYEKILSRAVARWPAANRKTSVVCMIAVCARARKSD